MRILDQDRIVGLGAGFLTTMAYMVFEASLIGIFAFFANDTFNSLFNINVSWVVFAIGIIVAMTPVSAFRPRRWRGALLPLSVLYCHVAPDSMPVTFTVPTLVMPSLALVPEPAARRNLE